jgi:hypothetical protein
MNTVTPVTTSSGDAALLVGDDDRGIELEIIAVTYLASRPLEPGDASPKSCADDRDSESE